MIEPWNGANERIPLSELVRLMCSHNLVRTAAHPSNNFLEESFAALSTLVQREKNPLPRHSGIRALGHVGNPLAGPLIAEYRRHPSAETGFAVACALGKFANDPRAVETSGFRLSFRPTLGRFSDIMQIMYYAQNGNPC